MKRQRTVATTNRYIARLLCAIEELHYMCGHPGAADDVIDKIPGVLRKRLILRTGRYEQRLTDVLSNDQQAS